MTDEICRVSQHSQASATLVYQTSQTMAKGYRDAVNQFSTDAEREIAEKCAAAASNTGFFILEAMGYSTKEMQALAMNGGRS